MGLAGSVAVYFIVWWLVFFAVLPFGASSQADHGDRVLGTEPGAPPHPALKRKALVTTGISAAIFAVIYFFFGVLGLTLEDLII